MPARSRINQATLGGGAMSDNNGSETFQINHCTIAGNRSLTAGSGGGIDCYGASSITMTHTVLAGNTANGTLRNYGTGGNSTAPDISSGGYNLSDDAPAGLTGPGDQINSTSINLGALANNGGPTKTMLPASTSAAVDAGDPDFTDDDAQDQRNFHRLQGARIDIGAVEAGATVTVTTVADEDDHVLGGGTGISLREAIKYLPAGNTIRFDPTLSGKTIVLTDTLDIEKSVAVIASDLPDGITISGDHAWRIFSLAAHTSLETGRSEPGGRHFAGYRLLRWGHFRRLLFHPDRLWLHPQRQCVSGRRCDLVPGRADEPGALHRDRQ